MVASGHRPSVLAHVLFASNSCFASDLCCETYLRDFEDIKSLIPVRAQASKIWLEVMSYVNAVPALFCNFPLSSCHTLLLVFDSLIRNVEGKAKVCSYRVQLIKILETTFQYAEVNQDYIEKMSSRCEAIETKASFSVRRVS